MKCNKFFTQSWNRWNKSVRQRFRKYKLCQRKLSEIDAALYFNMKRWRSYKGSSVQQEG